MAFRRVALEQATAGYDKTGVPLVAFDGTTLRPAGFTDDIGLYYLVPKISHALGISTSKAIDLSLFGIVAFSLALGIIGSLLLFKTFLGRFVAIAALLLLAFFTLKVSDIYVVTAAAPMATVPLFLYLVRRPKSGLSFVVFFSLSGIALGLAHMMRSQSGTAVFIFMLTVILFVARSSRVRKLLFITALLLGVLAPLLYFNSLTHKRDAYLARSDNYRPVRTSHPLWHSVYIGFGFLRNNYGIHYLDEAAASKVHSISPKAGYLSPEYEKTLKNEVFNLIKKDPWFVTRTLLAKFAVIGVYLVVFANVGLVAAAFYPKGRALEFAFWTAIGFSSLVGVLVMPLLSYLTGFVAFATLYAVVSINEAIERGAVDRLRVLATSRQGDPA